MTLRNTVLNQRSTAHQFLCGMLAALMAAAPAFNSTAVAAPAATEAKADLTRVIPGACLIVALRPAQVLASPAVELMPTEVLQAAMLQETGVDPLAAEQVVVSVVPPTAGPPSYSVLWKSSAAVNLKEGEITQHTQPDAYNGNTYRKSTEPMAPSFYPLDANTLLATPQYSLPQLVGATAAPTGDLVEKFAAADQGDDLLLMLDIEPLRPLINMGLTQAELPPEFPQLREIPNLVKTIQLRLNISHPGLSEFIVSANNEADAEKLVAMFEKAKELMQAKSAEATAKLLASDDPVEQASGRYSQRMQNYMHQNLNLVREAEAIVLLRADASMNPQQPMVMAATAGILVALLLPAVQAAREAARRNQSTNNMKQLTLAALNYESANKTYPPHASFDANGKPLLSWRVLILPYLEEGALYNQFRLDEPWDSPHNKALIAQMPELFLDPSSGLKPEDGKTHYLAVKGPDHFVTGNQTGRAIRTITDGTSNTIAIVQVGDEHAVTWTQPADYEPDVQNLLVGIGRLHPGGFIAGFCDGSVRFIAENIDQEMLKGLLTTSGEEVISISNY